VSEDEARANVTCQLQEVLVVPSGLDALEQRRRVALPVPSDSETVAVVVSTPSFECRLWSISECTGV
jgi:hypothetical protein